MLLQAASVHQRMAVARKNFDRDVNATFIEDMKKFMNTTLDEANVSNMVNFILLQ